jgi:hypothetical protein
MFLVMITLFLLGVRLSNDLLAVSGPEQFRELVEELYHGQCLIGLPVRGQLGRSHGRRLMQPAA